MNKRITVQPVFNYRNIVSAIFSDIENNDHLMLNTARSSLSVAIDTLLKNNKDIKQILLPDLICSEIIPIINNFDILIKFYSIDKNLNPDLNYINDKIKDKLSIVLIVNYFGFASNWSGIYNLKSDNCIIIEDNAHSLYGEYNNKNFGSLGDISFNSIRKILPVLSGSILKFNNNIAPDIKLKKRILNFSELKYSFRFLNNYTKINRKEISDETDCNTVQSIDYFSKKIYISQQTYQDSISIKRHNNYNIWKKYLGNTELEMIKPEPSICPYAFPCICADQKLFDEWVNWGIANNINIIKWPSFPKTNSHSLKYKELSKIILFPVNHTINLDFLKS